MKISPYTDSECIDLPHITLTSDATWDPTILDRNMFNDPVELSLNKMEINVEDINNEVHQHIRSPRKEDYESYRDHFLGLPVSIIERTFKSTTQYDRSGWIEGKIFDTWKSPFPALNIPRRNEPVATDTVFSDTPAIETGENEAQFFVGVLTKFCTIHGLRGDTHFVDTLMDVIRHHGAMDKLISDRDQLEISRKVQDVLRILYIKDGQTNPH